MTTATDTLLRLVLPVAEAFRCPVTRAYADWERCAENMSGIHTWVLVDDRVREGRKVVNKRKPACHRCGALVPAVRRGRITAMLLAAEEEAREIEARRRLLKETMRHTG